MAGRNVILQDFDGNTIAGFWQSGSTSWNMFSTLLPTLIYITDSWSIFEFDASSPNRHGEQRFASDAIVNTGAYILLRKDGSPIDVRLTDAVARPRQPTHSSTAARTITANVHAIDGKCLLTGLQSHTRRRLKAAHIFPRVHDVEWNRRGFPSLVTDPAPTLVLGGPSKIDSIQNVILLRSDLHDAWDNYEFAVNPDDNYKVTAFIEHHDDVHGLTLQLDHIADPNLRPLDELLGGHFLQDVLKYMKGAGEPTWDHEDNLGDGAFDLSRRDIWGNSEGRERLELELADRLFGHRAAQDLNI